MNSLIRVGAFAVIIAGSAYSQGTYTGPPLAFERLAGESNGTFAAHISGHMMAFGVSGTIFEQSAPVLRFLGARGHARPQAVGPKTGTANYITGSHPEQWRTGVPLFKAIRYSRLYPGVDLIYYGKQNRLEYDLVVAPGASWRSIRLAFDNSRAAAIDGQGGLRLEAGNGWIMHSRPVIYQDLPGGRREVSGRYVIRGSNEIGFAIGAYDRNRPLVIDPALAFVSYLGGSGNDYGHAIAVDSSGCAYVAGETGSTNFPKVNPEQSAMSGTSDIFVTKWNAAGTGLVYSTYIGGSNRDVAMGLAVDASGNAYVTGFTYSGDFPITSGALRASFVGASKAFVLKLNAAGNGLIYSTYLGGSGDDYGAAIAVDAAGEAHVAGYTDSIDFPATAGALQTVYGGGSNDGFLAKLNAAGSALVYATYLGGLANDTAAALAVDRSGNFYVTGQTQSANFPVLNPLQAVNTESGAFVVKIGATGQTQYATYLGGTGLTGGTGIAADGSGNAYVTGYTTAPDFPVTATAYQPAAGGSYDAFVATLNSNGSAILNATYLGGAGSDTSYGVALDGSGNVIIAGSTSSSNFPLAAPTQPAYGGGDAFVAEFNNQLSTLSYATYFGGAGSDVAAGIAADAAGNAYITGWTSSGGSSLGLPITPSAFQPMGLGGIDAFVAKLSTNTSPLACSTAAPQALTVPAGSASQQVGDFLLTCTGGTPGTQAMANFQVALNAPVSGSQAEIFVGANANPLYGILSGSTAILFSGITFAAPGPSASITLRITNVWANLSAIASGQQIVMTLSVPSSSPALTAAPAQQTVALAQSMPAVQLQQLVLSKGSAPANCLLPPVANGFLVSDTAALAWFQLGNTVAGGVARVDWYAPWGAVYQSHSLTATSGGTQCFWDSMAIAGSNSPMPGAWQANVYWNNTMLLSAPFVVSPAGNELIWQDTATTQVNMHYYNGTTDVGWASLNANGDPGWTVVAMADMNRDGVPDLIWQNHTTRQVVVDYYGAPGGTAVTGWAWLNCAGNVGWTVVAAADMNGDGVPDLIWQNDATRQVTVNYYGGSGGAAVTGWAWLNSAGNPGWTVVAAADMNGDKVPDLIWQNDTTRQVSVNYYGGAGRTTVTGWNWLNSIGNPGWTVVGASDFDGNGTPDLIWQNNSTGQVTVNYYGGAQGATLQGWAWLNSTGDPGWRAVD